MTDHTVDTVSPDGASADTGVTPADTAAPGTANEAASPATPEATPPAPADEKPQAKPDHWANKRLGEYAAKVRGHEGAIAERDRQIAELTRRLNPQPDGQQPPARAPTREDFDREVQRVAAQHAQAAEGQRAFQAWDEAGVKASSTFHEDCARLAHAGASSAAVQVLMDLDDSPAVVARLAADPAEAERIFALPAHRAALALAKFAAKAPPATPVSRAPAPLSPVAGTAQVEADPDKMSMAEWMKWRDAKDAKRK